MERDNGYTADNARIPGPFSMDGGNSGDTLRRMARNKAPGLYEWRVYEMRAWPKHLLDATAELLESVEEKGQWPEDLAGPLGIL